ncbi:hypothetical protein [Pararobbsia silviterrae]|uniref:Uncharacterized protein n=1 Tax=Pararobbsia silviterrae TaxID=1792498 RepID=A0A494Y3Z1_9BURK|nr:hypothetical protein [Pararobbsia silviterrae]RKP54626.1 hypothetical protein D7S86_13275 [Pararobbsia silviterrae]
MRSTKAIHAVERLRKRSAHPDFAAVSLPGGLFYLIDRHDPDTPKLCPPLPVEAFVDFVDGLSPEKPRKTSKLDVEFEEQIRKSRG